MQIYISLNIYNIIYKIYSLSDIFHKIVSSKDVFYYCIYYKLILNLWCKYLNIIEIVIIDFVILIN